MAPDTAANRPPAPCRDDDAVSRATRGAAATAQFATAQLAAAQLAAA